MKTAKGNKGRIARAGTSKERPIKILKNLAEVAAIQGDVYDDGPRKSRSPVSKNPVARELPAQLIEAMKTWPQEDLEFFKQALLQGLVLEMEMKDTPSRTKKTVLPKPDSQLGQQQNPEAWVPPPSKEPQGPRRDRSGYTAPTRAGKVSIQTFVEPEVRDKFNELATAAGIPAAELLRHLVENTVAKGTDASVTAAINDEARRAEVARKRLLRSIVPASHKPGHS